MAIFHTDVSGKAPAADPTKIGGPEWDKYHTVTGGVDGDCLVVDSAEEEGRIGFASRLNAVPVNSNDEIPVGEARLFFDGSVLAIRYNDNGTFYDIGITL